MSRRAGLLLFVLALATVGCAGDDVPTDAAEAPIVAPEPDTVLTEATDGPVEPTPAPDFALPGLSGPFALADHRGEVVVLNFWATWNEVSVEGMEALGHLHDTLHEDGVVVVGLAEDDDATETLQMWAKANDLPSYPLVADTARAVARRYGEVELLPTTVVVDREGFVRARHTGILDEDGLLDLLGPVLIEDDEPFSGGPGGVATIEGVALITAPEAPALVRSGAVLVDVRKPKHRLQDGALMHALYRPLELLGPDDLPANVATPLVFVCEDGEASAVAAERAREWGYRAVYRLDGGVVAWQAAGLPLDPIPSHPDEGSVPVEAAPIVPAEAIIG